MKLQIREDFKKLIPPLSNEEYRQLESNILADGIRDPLVLWGDILVDGHNRYEIAEKNGIPFTTVSKDFEDENDAVLWILRNQLGRRNLNDFQRVELARMCEDAVKEKARQRQESTQFGGSGKISLTAGQARDELGAIAGVSGKTYEHAAAVIDKAPESVKAAARNNEISINAAYEVTRLPFDAQREISDRIEQGESAKDVVSDVKNKPHVSYNSGNNEWYTPKEFIDAAAAAMGSIDTDPASSDIANKIVGANQYYTIETNGLDKDWIGNVWLNPPYSSDLIDKFIDKLVLEVDNGNTKQAIVLVNNATETGWFGKIVKKASAICFPKSRVKFYMPDGKTGAPLQGQAVLYIGSEYRRFLDAYSAIGWGCIPEWIT